MPLSVFIPARPEAMAPLDLLTQAQSNFNASPYPNPYHLKLSHKGYFCNTSAEKALITTITALDRERVSVDDGRVQKDSVSGKIICHGYSKRAEDSYSGKM
ncbi:unnamed protein product [Pleuronectes platessa]|uniref:Uncharacterized protein n=1 Tax=Pleuronectes platessa TaxID=8262 RepID=A0A9N7U6E5_PLEPL|nr:unnamed protein product [Pleuronectes platessa]